MMEYKQNPFSNIWSKLASLPRFMYFFDQETGSDIEPPLEADTDVVLDKDKDKNRDNYVHITDWVEPSVYFTIFNSQNLRQ